MGAKPTELPGHQRWRCYGNLSVPCGGWQWRRLGWFVGAVLIACDPSYSFCVGPPSNFLSCCIFCCLRVGGLSGALPTHWLPLPRDIFYAHVLPTCHAFRCDS